MTHYYKLSQFNTNQAPNRYKQKNADCPKAADVKPQKTKMRLKYSVFLYLWLIIQYLSQ